MAYLPGLRASMGGGEMSRRIVHMCINVRGALKNFRKREWKRSCTDPDTGRFLTPDEVRDVFLDELSRGHEVIPIGNACEGFDYLGGGCPGHPVEEP